MSRVRSQSVVQCPAASPGPDALRYVAAIRRFEDIEAWKACRRLSQEFSRILRETKGFKHQFLVTQLTKCADSAKSNNVEGFDSGSAPEFHRFLRIAYRSLSEFQSHLYSAMDENCLDRNSFDHLYGLAREAKSLTGGFMRYLKKARPQ